MRSRFSPAVLVRVCAVSALVVFAVCTATSPAVHAQSAPPLTPFRGLIDFVSGNPQGAASGASQLEGRAMSGDGRYVVFSSTAYDLVPGDNNWAEDIFVRDRMTGITTRASVADDGSEPDGMSQWAALSADGQHVVFASGASNLVTGDTNGVWDVFVRDLDRGRTVRVSVATDGTQGDTDAYFPAISATGRFIVFISNATTLAPGVGAYEPYQAYLHDRDADANGVFDEAGGTTTEIVSVSSSGARADCMVDRLRVSGDGRLVMFESKARNLDAAGNPNDSNHLYVHDVQTGETTLIDRAVTGGPSSWGVEMRTSDMSDDGRFITYVSMSQDIVWLDMNWVGQVFRYDAAADPIERTSIVTKLPDGTLADDSSYVTSVSNDGRYVAFTTSATNLVYPSASPGALVVRDMIEGTFTRVDVLAAGEPFDAPYPYSPSLSGDGTAVAFTSSAGNVLGGIYTNDQHVFVATAFAVSENGVPFPMEGGARSFDVNTTPVSGWRASTSDPWIVLMDGAGFGAGPRTVQYVISPNESGIVRNGTIRAGSMTVYIYQAGDGDATPPVITPIITGTRDPSGWYTSDIELRWSVVDPDSEIVSMSPGCTSTFTYTTDFLLATPNCEATSHGGTASWSEWLRRDTTAPSIAITTPAATVYRNGASVAANYTCSEPYGYAGVASCAISEGASPLDTTPGRHRFTVTATDRVGNTGSKAVEYLVGTGTCVTPNDNLLAWFRFDGDGADALGHLYASPTPAVPLYYIPGVAGQAWQSQGQTYLDTYDWQRLLAPEGLTVATWIRPTGVTGESGTIVSKPAQYRIARFPDGTLRWAFSQTTGFDWVNTGIVLPTNVWTHVAVSYDNGLVTTYINGRQAHTQQLTGTMAIGSDWSQSLTVGGRADATAILWGWFDELQIFGTALSAEGIEAIALAGDGGLCAPRSTAMTVTAPATASYGSTIPASVTLRDGDGNPVSGKRVVFYSWLSTPGAQPGVASALTDANGIAEALVPVEANAALGTYASGLRAQFDGDVTFTPSSAWTAITVVPGAATITWPSPAPIAYGTALGAAQLNATANATGTFTYSPAAGAYLNAGTSTLSVTFTPADPRFVETAASTIIAVTKATPVMTATGGTYTYDKQPHPATGSATGVFGEPLSFDIYYSGSGSVPLNAGTYYAMSYYHESENYVAANSASVPIVIKRFVPIVEIYGSGVVYDAQPHQAYVNLRGVGGEYLSPFGVFYDGWTYTVPVQAGTHTVQVQYNGTYNYEAVRLEDGQFVINKATPSMYLNAGTVGYTGAPRAASASVMGVNYAQLGPVVITYDGSTTPPTGIGSYAVEARYEGSVNYNAVSRTGTLTIVKGTPVITWARPAGIVYGTPLGAAQLNAVADVAGTFQYSPGAGTVLDAGTPTLSVTFTPADTVNYNSATRTVLITVSKATPAIAWPAPADVVYGTALGSAQLNATANAAGTFVYSPAPGTIPSAGVRTLSTTFTPSDPVNYNGATASVTLTVLKATPVITWPTPADVEYGTALGAAQLTATANTQGVFAYAPPSGSVLEVGPHVLSVTFTPTFSQDYVPTTASVTLTVVRATPTVTWTAPAPIVYGTMLTGSQLDATANVPGSFEYSPGAGSVLDVGQQTLSVVFTPADTTRYAPITVTTTIAVTAATPAITWPPPDAIVYGTALGEAQLNASASVPGTFSYTPAAGTILPVLRGQPQMLSVVFTPDDQTRYVSASRSTSIWIMQAAPKITWPQPAMIVYGTALGTQQLNAVADVPGTFTYDPPAGTVLQSGPNQWLRAAFVPDDAVNYTNAMGVTTISVNNAVPVITWAAPSPVQYGTAMGPAQYNATADVPGTFTYYPAPGTVLPVGPAWTLRVEFTPEDSRNYFPKTVYSSIQVLKAPLTIRTNDTSKAYGAPLPAFTATAAGFVNGDSMTSLFGALVYSTTASTWSGVGTYAVTPSGLSSSSYEITYLPGTLTVQPAATAIAVSSSGTPSGESQGVTFAAAVAPIAPGAGVPQGTVQFMDGATLLGTVGLVNGAASLNTNGLAEGVHTISVLYSGSPTFAGSTASMAQTVNGLATSTTTTLTSSPNPSNTGQSVRFTATVTSPSEVVSTGTVEFYDGATLLGTGGVGAGTASFVTAALAPGGHAITARFLGNASVPPSTSAVLAQTVQASGSKTRSASVSVVAAPPAAPLGTEVALTASVAGGQRITPTGSVLYLANGLVIGRADVAATGATTAAAILRTSGLAHGTHDVTAVYLGDGNYRASAATVSVTVN